MNNRIKTVLDKIIYPFAKRFIAGNEPEDAINVTEKLNKKGVVAILNFLGEDIKTTSQAAITRNFYILLIRAIWDKKLQARISIKPSQLGLQIDPVVYLNNLLIIGKAAIKFNIPVEIDIEHSKDVESTVNAAATLKHLLPELDLRQAVQMRLKRTPKDIKKLSQAGVKIRLCKGAYKDDESALIYEKFVISQYTKIARQLISKKTNPAIATLDYDLLKKFISKCESEKCEIQLLYGFQKRLAYRLGRKNLPCAVYVPFGTNWLPYGMRRFKYILSKLPSIIKDEIILLFE